MTNKRLRVELLGAPRAFDGGEALAISRKRVRAILYYLVAERTPVSRASLAWMLWPDKDPATANRNLSIHVSYLKNATDENIVEISPLGISISPDIDSDVVDFFELTSTGSEDDAIAVHRLFRGDFLEGCMLKGAEPYNQWIATQRERWSQRRDTAALETALVLEKRGIYDTALSLVEEVIERNPTREESYRRAMAIASKAQLTDTVNKLFATLCDELDKAYGTSPSLETAQCYRNAIGKSVAVEASTSCARRDVFKTSDAPFIGRDSQLETLLATQSGSLALALGEDGMGKTRMLCEASKRLEGHRLFISFNQQNGSMPFGALIEALHQTCASSSLTQAKRDAFDSLSKNDADSIAFVFGGPFYKTAERKPTPRSLDGIRGSFERLLAEMGREQPVHFLMDNMQHADPYTLSLLDCLMRNGAFAASKFIGALSASDFGPNAPVFLNKLKRENRLCTVALDPIDAAKVADVIAQYYPSLQGETAMQLASFSQGKPLWMKGIIREIDLGHSSFSDGDTAEGLLDHSLSLLSPNAHDIMAMLAAANAPMEMSLIEMLCGRQNANAALQELEALGFAKKDACSMVALPTEAIRRAILRGDGMGPDTLKATHLRIARAMEAAYGEEPTGLQDITTCQHYRESSRPEECGVFAARSADYLASIGDKQGACLQLQHAQAHLHGAAKVDASLALCTLLTEQGRFFEAQCALEDAIRTAESQGLSSTAAIARAVDAALGHSAFVELCEGRVPAMQTLDESLKNKMEEAAAAAKSPEVSPLVQMCAIAFCAGKRALEGNTDQALACLDTSKVEGRVGCARLGKAFLVRLVLLRRQIEAMRPNGE